MVRYYLVNYKNILDNINVEYQSFIAYFTKQMVGFLCFILKTGYFWDLLIT